MSAYENHLADLEASGDLVFEQRSAADSKVEDGQQTPEISQAEVEPDEGLRTQYEALYAADSRNVFGHIATGEFGPILTYAEHLKEETTRLIDFGHVRSFDPTFEPFFFRTESVETEKVKDFIRSFDEWPSGPKRVPRMAKDLLSNAHVVTDGDHRIVAAILLGRPLLVNVIPVSFPKDLKQPSDYFVEQPESEERAAGGVGSGTKGHRTIHPESQADEAAEAAQQQSLSDAQKSYLAHPMAVWGLDPKLPVARYTAAYGQECPTKPYPKLYQYATSTPNQCFKNASLLVAYSSSLRYAEGWATLGGSTYQHAWAVDTKGRVVDPTYKNDGHDYFGIVYDREKYLEHLKTTSTYGVVAGSREIATRAIATGGLGMRAK